MTIIFICGSLEPGKDGVGDYTRRLCAYILKQGLEVGILALNDRFINSVKEEQQYSDDESISCYRLPNTTKADTRSKLAKAWVDIKNPQWISLQFVPYAFHKKGLPFGLSKQLHYIGKGRKWHIMFHELWLGLRITDSLKFKVIGFFQKSIVYFLNRKLRFEVIHTHTKFYLKVLENMNLNSQYLPIFSNIKFKRKSYNKESLFDEYNLVFVHFGTIHPNLPLAEFANELSLYSENNQKKRIALVLLGRSGNELSRWIEEFNGHNINVSVIGELPNNEISRVLQSANYGLTTNPVFVVEKSGTVAAMREHNLPILIVAEKTNPKNGIEVNLEEDFFLYENGNLSDFIKLNHDIKKLKSKGIEEISKQFLNNLLSK